MKKMLSLVMVLAMTLTLAACGGSSAPAATAAPAPAATEAPAVAETAAAPAAETDKSETAGVVAYLERSVKLRQSFFAASSCVDAARHQSRRLVVAKQRPLLIRTAAARVFTNLLHSHVNDKSGK